MTNEEVIRIAQGLITDFKCESETMVDFCNTIIEFCRDMEEIREVMSCDDADAETKCRMISDILTAPPHYFELCEDEYIKVPKKALKYRTAGIVAYNVEWLKNHFDIEQAVICGEQESCNDVVFNKGK